MSNVVSGIVYEGLTMIPSWLYEWCTVVMTLFLEVSSILIRLCERTVKVCLFKRVCRLL